jgi:hypothetical protein
LKFDGALQRAACPYINDDFKKLKKPMPIELHVIRASDFICFDPEEQLNFEESKRVLQELALACRKRGLDRAMVDLRELPTPSKPRFTDTELAAMIGAFRAAGFSRGQRLAILYREDVYGTVRNFAFFGRMHGLHVQAFHDFESAIHWLWQATEHAEHKHGDHVPIVRREATKPTAHLAGGIHRAAAPRPVRRFKRSHR